MRSYTAGKKLIVVHALAAISVAVSVLGCSAEGERNQPQTRILTDAKKDVVTESAKDELNRSWTGDITITNAKKDAAVSSETVVITGSADAKKLDYRKRGCFINEADRTADNRYSILKVDPWNPCANFQNGTLTLELRAGDKLFYRLDYGSNSEKFEEGILSPLPGK